MLKTLIFLWVTLVVLGCNDNSTTGEPDPDLVHSDESKIEKAATVLADSSLKQNSTVVNTTNPKKQKLTVLERSSFAYIDDPDPKGPTNVRASPNNGKVILKLPKDGDFYMFTITAKNGRWFRIRDISSMEEKNIKLPNNEGWVHGSVIQYDLRNDENPNVTLYSSPDKKAKTTLVQDYKHIRLVDLTDEWAEVSCQNKQKKVYQGWIKRDDLCGNPLTTCN